MAKTTSTNHLAKEIAGAVKKAAAESRTWYTPRMAAALRAITSRMPLVDLLVEVRDARIPLSSSCDLLSTSHHSSTRIIVMNKIDLANRYHLKDWISYFHNQNTIAYGVNSHNKDSIKEFLNFLQAQIRELKKYNNCNPTATIMLLGIPNVGKSALANSLHLIGRMSAAEKGKLRHTNVSPDPGETRDISGLKIGSHPNIYILDTPSMLPPKIEDDKVCSKLALTGAIGDHLVEEKELAKYFLTILNSSDEYKKWSRLSTLQNEGLITEEKQNCLGCSELKTKQKRRYPTDHTQDFIVHDVRRALFEAISGFNGDLERENDVIELVEAQFLALKKAFRTHAELDEEDAYKIVAAKLLNLYRTGRLGHYTLDPLPS